MAESQLAKIFNFLQLSDTIATAGQPTAEQFKWIKAAGYQVVINLALDNSTNALPNEREVVENQGLNYIHIPVSWEQPTVEDVAQFFERMNENINQKIFVHCAANKRVSAFMYLYRILQQGVSRQEAMKALHTQWVPNPTWQALIEKFMEAYSDKSSEFKLN